MNNYIFVHGIDTYSPGYAKEFAERVWKDGDKVYEIYWTLMEDVIEQFMYLQYPKKRKGKWKGVQKKVIPLAMQIINYVRKKDKSDELYILKSFHEQFKLAYKAECKNILVTHSLGAVIAFDYLFRFKTYGLRPDHKIDAFFTMGSPVPIFTASMGYPVNYNLEQPANLGPWINILDADDGIAQFTEPHFHKLDIQDKRVKLGWLPIKTHGKYWKSRKVYQYIKENI